MSTVEDLKKEESSNAKLPSYSSAKHQTEKLFARVSRHDLPRVTAYCTANSLRFDELLRWLESRRLLFQTNPRKFDEAIYSPISNVFASYGRTEATRSRISTSRSIPREKLSSFVSTQPLQLDKAERRDRQHLQNNRFTAVIPGQTSTEPIRLRNSLTQPDLSLDSYGDAQHIVPGEVFFFDYGVVVLWGLSEAEEAQVLEFTKEFEEERLSNVEIEEFRCVYSSQYQSRIYNDIITLKNPHNYMIKLSISHAIAQSVKLTLFEQLIDTTIGSMKRIPQIMSSTGKIHLSRNEINRKIGQLFIVRINVNLVSNVLDTPEIFWAEPALDPLYQAIRGYLEINQRVELLNQRVGVIGDLLEMLKEHLTSHHNEQLEWIVIILIALEIVIGLITISVDYSSLN